MNTNDPNGKPEMENGTETQWSDDTLLNLIRSLENCDDDCEEIFRALDQYAEIQIRKEDAARLMPIVHDHLETCTECCDAYEALLDVLAKAGEPQDLPKKNISPGEIMEDNPPNPGSTNFPPEMQAGQPI